MSEPATGRYAEQLFTKMTVTVTMSIWTIPQALQGDHGGKYKWHIGVHFGLTDDMLFFYSKPFDNATDCAAEMIENGTDEAQKLIDGYCP